MSRSEETQPAVLYSVEIVMWAGDEIPSTAELEAAIWDGLNLAHGQYGLPAAIYVKTSPFNPTEGENDA